MKKKQILPVSLQITLLMLSGCYRKLSSDELWEKANQKYQGLRYQEAVIILEKMDKEYPFENNSLDALILLVKSYDKRVKESPIFKNAINGKICRTADEVISRDRNKAFLNGVMTIQIKAQYQLCILNLKYSDKMLHKTSELIENYFDYVAKEYKKKISSKNKMNFMTTLIKELDGPEYRKLELAEMFKIYKECQNYIKEKRKLIVEYVLKNSGTANALQENESLLADYEYRDPKIILNKIKLYIAMQEENLKSRAEEKEIAMVVEDVIVMIKDLKKISDDKALLNTAMLELNRFLNNFNYKLNSEQKFLLQKMTS